jgi:DNA repair protein RecO (recombination protein O)
MSRLAKATALILRCLPFKESDLIVTALTSEAGCLSFLAKGARGAKSRFGAALDLLNLTELVYYDRPQLKLLSQADIMDGYLHLKSDYDRLQLALRAARQLLLVLEEGGRDGSSFTLFQELLTRLDQAPIKHLAVYELAFKLKLAQVLGVAPRFDRCASCGASLQGALWFSVERGGVIGEECHVSGKAPRGMPLDPGSAKGLQVALHLPFAKLDRLKLSAQQIAQGETLIDGFIAYHLHPIRLR